MITLIWTILALVCIVLGFVGELVDEKILMGTLEWFVAAIAFNSLGGLPGVFAKRRGYEGPNLRDSGRRRKWVAADRIELLALEDGLELHAR